MESEQAGPSVPSVKKGKRRIASQSEESQDATELQKVKRKKTSKVQPKVQTKLVDIISKGGGLSHNDIKVLLAADQKSLKEYLKKDYSRTMATCDNRKSPYFKKLFEHIVLALNKPPSSTTTTPRDECKVIQLLTSLVFDNFSSVTIQKDWLGIEPSFDCGCNSPSSISGRVANETLVMMGLLMNPALRKGKTMFKELCEDVALIRGGGSRRDLNLGLTRIMGYSPGADQPMIRVLWEYMLTGDSIEDGIRNDVTIELDDYGMKRSRSPLPLIAADIERDCNNPLHYECFEPIVGESSVFVKRFCVILEHATFVHGRKPWFIKQITEHSTLDIYNEAMVKDIHEEEKKFRSVLNSLKLTICSLLHVDYKFTETLMMICIALRKWIGEDVL